MIIKKWNASLVGTNKWEAQAVETTAQSIKTTMDPTGTAIFDSNNKILPNHLPDSVFDSLYFYGAADLSEKPNLSYHTANAIFNAESIKRSSLGYYKVVNVTGSLTANNTPAKGFIDVLNRIFTATIGSNILTSGNTSGLKVGMSVATFGSPSGIPESSNATITNIIDATSFSISVNATQNGAQFVDFGYFVETYVQGGEESEVGQPISPVTLEAGDWFVITDITGTGVSGDPYIATYAIVNNTYELMKGATSTTAGAPGLVPGPSAGQEELYLKGNGQWGTPLNTTYSEISESEIDSTTDSNGRLITGRRAQHLLRNNVTTSTTANFATGATEAFGGKTVNLGTAGIADSTTTINIGSAVSGAFGTTTIHSPTTNVKNLVSASTQASGNIVSITGNSLTDGNALLIQSDRGATMIGSLLNVTGTGAMTSGDLAKFQNNAYVGSTTSGLVDVISTSTARAAGSQLIRVASSGANATASREVIGGVISVKNTGTSSTNTGLSLDVSGATTNRAINVVAGNTVLQAMSATTGTFSAAISATTGTFSGDIAVNGGDITTSAETFNIGSTATTAQTLNLANATTGNNVIKTVSIGASGANGSTTNITLGSTTTGALGTTTIATVSTAIRAAASTTNSGTHFPVFTSDPATTAQGIVTRTAAQMLSDIGAAASSHTHGDISNAGAIASTVVAPGDGDHIIISDSSDATTANILKRSIAIGTSTTTFLTEAGTWATPVGTQYTAGEGLTLTSTAFSQTYPVYHADSLPTSGISNNAIGFEW
jgi:hypothetical protein